MLLGIVEIAARDERRPARGRPGALRARRAARAARCWSQRILALPRDDRWQTMARAALRDDLHAVHAQLTAQVLRATVARRLRPGPDRGLGGRRRASSVRRAAATLEEICADDEADLARMSVGLRVVRGLLSTG